MPKTIHTATAPDGSTFRRTSQSRVYSHMVTGRSNERAHFADADAIRDQDRRNFDYYVEVAAGTHPHVQPEKWRPQEQCDADIAKHRAKIEGLDRDSYAAKKREERLAAHAANVAAGMFTKWRDLGWASRLDLARKAASTAARHYVDVRILEAKAGA